MPLYLLAEILQFLFLIEGFWEKREMDFLIPWR